VTLGYSYNTLPIILSFKLVNRVCARCIQCKIPQRGFSHSCKLLSHFFCLQSKPKWCDAINFHRYFHTYYNTMIWNLWYNNTLFTFASPFMRMVSISSSVMAESLEANTWFAPYRIMLSISSLFSWFCLLSTRRPVKTNVRLLQWSISRLWSSGMWHHADRYSTSCDIQYLQQQRVTRHCNFPGKRTLYVTS